MQGVVVAMILVISAIAQNEAQSPVLKPACGPKDISFDVKRDDTQHMVAEPEPGKARVYFIQDDGIVSCLGSCGIVKIGLDGAWEGATEHNSYFSVSVTPGEHHLCAVPQSRFQAGHLAGLAHFTAEAGKTYYFRARSISGRDQSLFDFGPVDSDQGKYLVATYPLSVSKPKR